MVTCVSTCALEHPRPTQQEAPTVFIVSENSKMDELQECCEICPFRQTLAQVNQTWRKCLRGKEPEGKAPSHLRQEEVSRAACST